MAAPTDSRLGPGVLSLGSTDFGAQISNVTLEPSQDSTDGTPTLGDPDPAPLIEESWVLSGEAIQDFGDADGFLNYCFDNALSEVAFTFEPDSTTAGSSVYAGTCLITSVPIGGDVSAQITSAFEFPVVGTPTRTNPATMSGAGAEETAARAKRRSRAKSSKAEE
jgi:hypothetical protein